MYYNGPLSRTAKRPTVTLMLHVTTPTALVVQKRTRFDILDIDDRDVTELDFESTVS